MNCKIKYLKLFTFEPINSKVFFVMVAGFLFRMAEKKQKQVGKIIHSYCIRENNIDKMKTDDF